MASWFGGSSKPKRAPADDVPLTDKEECMRDTLLALIAQSTKESTTTHATQILRSVHREDKKTRLAKALAWHREDVKWRQEVSPQRFVEGSEEFHATLPQVPYYIYGQDKKGHPVLYNSIPDDTSILEKMSQDQQIERICRPLEQLELLTKNLRHKHDSNLYQSVYVLDVGNAGFGNLSKAFFNNMKLMFKLLQAHYCEVFDMIYIINASMAFRAGWKVVSPWIDAGTREKVKVYGGSYLTKLTKQIDIEQIPPTLGGKGPVEWRLGEITLLGADAELFEMKTNGDTTTSSKLEPRITSKNLLSDN